MKSNVVKLNKEKSIEEMTKDMEAEYASVSLLDAVEKVAAHAESHPHIIQNNKNYLKIAIYRIQEILNKF